MNSVKETREQRIIKDVLVLFGEKETKLNECLKYWDKEKHDNINKFTLNIIKGADHSFFGWQFKWDVEKSIIDWLSNQSN